MTRLTCAWIRPLAALPVVALLAIAAPAGEDSDRHVRRRVAAMYQARAALERLVDMSGGRWVFDAALARAARGELIAHARAIPGLFRRQRMDTQSLALPSIWLHWGRFQASARQTERAARALETGALNRMRTGLPAVLNTCLDCHRQFRKPP